MQRDSDRTNQSGHTNNEHQPPQSAQPTATDSMPRIAVPLSTRPSDAGVVRSSTPVASPPSSPTLTAADASSQEIPRIIYEITPPSRPLTPVWRHLTHVAQPVADAIDAAVAAAPRHPDAPPANDGDDSDDDDDYVGGCYSTPSPRIQAREPSRPRRAHLGAIMGSKLPRCAVRLFYPKLESAQQQQQQQQQQESQEPPQDPPQGAIIAADPSPADVNAPGDVAAEMPRTPAWAPLSTVIGSLHSSTLNTTSSVN